MMDSNTTTELRFSVDNLQTGNHLCSATCPLSITYGVESQRCMNPFPGSFLPSRRTVTVSLVVVRFGMDVYGGGHLHT